MTWRLVWHDGDCEVGVRRPQGGGGVDHRHKVQQRKVQTDIHFFLPPLVLTTRKSNIDHPKI
jgi:hypothetical protein